MATRNKAAYNVPDNERERIDQLIDSGLLDGGQEEPFDRLTRLASDLLGFPIAAVNLITEDTQWTKSGVGLRHGEEHPREDSFCALAILEPNETMVVPDALEDKRFDGNRQVADGLRAYAGTPLVTSQGRAIGSFCIADNEAREIGEREVGALQSLAAAVMTEFDLRDRNARLEELTRTDPLTELFNRRALFEELDREIARARRSGKPLSLAMVDLDHFKVYNDTRGHPAGDRLLRAVADVWKEAVRTVDLVARYGGEEFAFAFPACDGKDAVTLMDRLRELVPERQTCSAGLVVWTGEESADALIKRGDEALYAAKRAGRDCCVLT